MDENEDYLISPAYYNGEDNTINIANAKAEQITMITYSGEPVDQGVSLFGVTFGMTKSAVKAMLGEPMSDNDDYFEWQVAVSDASYEGSFSIYFTDDAGTAGASQIDLSLIENNSNFGEQGGASTLHFKLIHKNYQNCNIIK